MSDLGTIVLLFVWSFSPLPGFKNEKKKDLLLGTTIEWKILENDPSRVGTNGEALLCVSSCKNNVCDKKKKLRLVCP